jgi:hypothetical protein
VRVGGYLRLPSTGSELAAPCLDLLTIAVRSAPEGLSGRPLAPTPNSSTPSKRAAAASMTSAPLIRKLEIDLEVGTGNRPRKLELPVVLAPLSLNDDGRVCPLGGVATTSVGDLVECWVLVLIGRLSLCEIRREDAGEEDAEGGDVGRGACSVVDPDRGSLLVPLVLGLIIRLGFIGGGKGSGEDAGEAAELAGEETGDSGELDRG